MVHAGGWHKNLDFMGSVVSCIACACSDSLDGCIIDMAMWHMASCMHACTLSWPKTHDPTVIMNDTNHSITYMHVDCTDSSLHTQVPPQDAAATAAGALCTRIDAFGALSFKAPGTNAFPASTRLHLDLFSATGDNALNRLAIQLEGSSAENGAHAVSPFMPLSQLMKGGGLPSAADMVAADSFPGLASFDRITIGRCLEQQNGGVGSAGQCTDMDAGPIVLCISRLSADIA